MNRLKAHLLTRLPGGDYFVDHKPSVADIRSVRIWNDEIYVHKVMRVNYDTYDMRREQDSVNPDSHPDVMMLAPDEDEHPYLYARVLGIFHVNACRITPESTARGAAPAFQTFHLLWVRWFDYDATAPGGFTTRRLHRLRWTSLDNDAFGFISPDVVLRGCHLIPGFHHGKSDCGLPGASIARRLNVRDAGCEGPSTQEDDDTRTDDSDDTDSSSDSEDSPQDINGQLDWNCHYVGM